MRASLLLILISEIFVLSGVCGGVLSRAGLCRLKASFFLLCVFVTDSFLLRPSEQLYVSPACVIIPVFVYCAAYFSGEPKPALSVPMSLLVGALLFPLTLTGEEWTAFAIGAVSALPAFILDTLTSASSAALAPLIAQISAFAYCSVKEGYASLDLSGAALTSQLFALICVFMIKASIQKERYNGILRSRVS